MFNTAYQPDPDLATADRFTFPYADESFDFAFAHSVFTHLPADSVANYLGETHRVLRPGGILYATWFLFDTRPDGHPNPIVDAMQLEPSGDVAVRFPDIPDAATGIGPGTSGTSTAREGSPSSTPSTRDSDACRTPWWPSGGHLTPQGVLPTAGPAPP